MYCALHQCHLAQQNRARHRSRASFEPIQSDLIVHGNTTAASILDTIEHFQARQDTAPDSVVHQEGNLCDRNLYFYKRKMHGIRCICSKLIVIVLATADSMLKGSSSAKVVVIAEHRVCLGDRCDKRLTSANCCQCVQQQL